MCLCLSVCLCQPDGSGRIVYASARRPCMFIGSVPHTRVCVCVFLLLEGQVCMAVCPRALVRAYSALSCVFARPAVHVCVRRSHTWGIRTRLRHCVCVCVFEQPSVIDLWWSVCAFATCAYPLGGVCVCICVCVRPIAYACRKMTMGVCVYFFCMCVLWDQVCELAMAVPSVDGSARDLV